MIARTLRAATFLLTATIAACGASDPSGDSNENAPQMSQSPTEEGTISSQSVATCSGTPGQWAGCRGHGCAVCSEATQQYPYYFANHPKCEKNLTCAGQFYTCNSNCPAPTEADKYPTAGTCDGSPGGWQGCRGNGCAACVEQLTSYPFYFTNHPNCARNDTCAGQFYTCNNNCPAPTEADKLPPAGTCNGTAGQWNGCRGNGCAVCAEKLTAYPKYFRNHPNCAKNDTCAGQFYTCNSNCPAPTAADC